MFVNCANIRDISVRYQLVQPVLLLQMLMFYLDHLILDLKEMFWISTFGNDRGDINKQMISEN